MLDKETQKKIASCKALQGMTVEDFIKNDRFRENLAGYLTEQRETRKTARASYAAMRKVGGAKNLTVAQYVVEEYPELADELLPKSKSN